MAKINKNKSGIFSDISGLIKSIDIMRDTFKKEGVLTAEMKSVADSIADNVMSRFRATERPETRTYEPTGKLESEIKASNVVYTRKSYIVGIGNIENLDELTGVIAESTSAEYQYWKIQEEGAERHDIYPFNAKVLAFFHASSGRYIYTYHVDHPGVEGRHFFLTVEGNIHGEDERMIQMLINKLRERIKIASSRKIQALVTR